MPLFTYRAKQGPHKVVQGKLEAETEQVALEQLAASGLTPLELQPIMTGMKRLGISAWLKKRTSSRDVSVATFQLVDLLRAGLSLHKALETLSSQVEDKTVHEVLASIQSDVREGKSFSDALEQFPMVFAPFYVHMVRAGEASGNLDSVLERLAETLERDHELRAQIKQALAYPLLVAACGLITVFVILIYVIPRLQILYQDMGHGLPVITVVVVTISTILVRFWYVWGLLVGMCGLALKSMFSSQHRAYFFDHIALRLPLWGRILFREEIVRFARNLSMLLKSGVPYLESLLIAKNTMRSGRMQSEILRLHDAVQHGSSLHEAMRIKGLFPVFAINMIATGEESGAVDTALERVAHSYAKEINAQLKVILSLIEPLLILVVGVIVGIIVISMLLPIFQINIFMQ